VALIEVAVKEPTEAVVAPSFRMRPEANPVPVTTTGVPPAIGPTAGDIPVTVGGATYVNAFVSVPVVRSAFVTTTLVEPTACAGSVIPIVVAVTDVTVALAPPTVTVAPVRKFVPLIVAAPPPASAPAFGLILVGLGGGACVTVTLAVEPLFEAFESNPSATTPATFVNVPAVVAVATIVKTADPEKVGRVQVTVPQLFEQLPPAGGVAETKVKEDGRTFVKVTFVAAPPVTVSVNVPLELV
jgi:hypothetical protein